MKSGQDDHATNVVLLRTRSSRARDPIAGGAQDGKIIRLLDLSKYQHPRPVVDNYAATMRANIAAIVLLGLLVFIAKEDFCKLERANQCSTRSVCFN